MVVAIVAVGIISVWALIRTYTSGKIEDKTIKNNKGEVIYKVEE